VVQTIKNKYYVLVLYLYRGKHWDVV